MNWSVVLLRLALVFYLVGFLNTFVPALGATRRMLRATPWLAGAGAASHTAALVALGLQLNRCPINTLPEILSLLAWAAVLVYLVTFWRAGLEVLHIIILPLVLVILFVSNLLPEETIPVTPTLQPALKPLHFTVIVLAMAALSITFAASLIYLAVDRALKSKRPVRFFLRLPSLETCDNVGQISLMWAFPLMTLGIITGALLSAALHHTFWTWQRAETLAVLGWCILGIVVVARLGWGWRGRKAALLTILGFVAVLLRMLGFY